MLKSYHLMYVDKWYSDILIKIWHVDIHVIFFVKRYANVDIHYGITVCSHLYHTKYVDSLYADI